MGDETVGLKDGFNGLIDGMRMILLVGTKDESSWLLFPENDEFEVGDIMLLFVVDFISVMVLLLESPKVGETWVEIVGHWDIREIMYKTEDV